MQADKSLLYFIACLCHLVVANHKDLCYKQSICNSLSAPVAVCRTLYKCSEKSDHLFANEVVASVLGRQSQNRVTRSIKGGLLFGRPFRRPKDTSYRKECQKCESKRSKCFAVSWIKRWLSHLHKKLCSIFQYYVGTYGLCGGAWLIGGSLGSTLCNLVTIPRTVDCMLNTYSNCYLRHCGLVGIWFWSG